MFGLYSFFLFIMLCICNLALRINLRGLRLKHTTKRYSVVSSDGFKFFESLGSPRFISAPMVDQSELAFRLLVRKNGADLAYTQMMHARNFMNDKKYRNECIDWLNYSHRSGDESIKLKTRELDRPLIGN